MKEEKGFTLIELLIVIVILGVLAAAIIPNLSKFVSSGNIGVANAELGSVKTSVSAYQADNNGAYPIAANGSVDSVKIQNYMSGTIKGDYTVNTVTGVVSGLTYPGATWDPVSQSWKK